MSSSLIIKTNLIGNRTIVQLSGKINEDADFSSLRMLKSAELYLDVSQITQINSPGIREWLNFLDSIPGNIIYLYCPQIMVEQINMIHGFIRPNVKIHSFYAPYFCDQCQEERKILLEAQDIIENRAPLLTCEKCQNLLEFDAIEEQYLKFAKTNLAKGSV